MEVADPADHRGRGDHLVAVARELGHQRDVLGVALDEAVAGMVVVGAPHRAVLAEVVDAHHLVTGGEQLGDQVAADEAGRAGDQDLHSV